MYSYVVEELPQVIAANFRADLSAQRHHGALDGRAWRAHHRAARIRSSTARFPPLRRSARPRRCPGARRRSPDTWGTIAPRGRNTTPCELIKPGQRFPDTILVDQGTSDKFLKDQLRPELLADACKAAGQPLDLRMHSGYDHGYFFIQSFIAGHMEWHGRRLLANAAR